MEIRKKIDPDKREELESLMDDCEDLGFEFIQLRFGKQSKYPIKMRGRESLAVIRNRQNGTTYTKVAGSKIVKDGVLFFYPDDKARCWGYMLDTPNNRKYLAGQLKISHVTITDSKIKKEIYKLAEDLGIETEVVQTDHTLDSYLKKEEKVEEVVEEKVVKEEVVESPEVRKIRLEAELKILELQTAKPVEEKVEEPKVETPKQPLRKAKRARAKSNK
jgi:hypothetical protein